MLAEPRTEHVIQEKADDDGEPEDEPNRMQQLRQIRNGDRSVKLVVSETPRLAQKPKIISAQLHAPFLTEGRTRGSAQCCVAGNPGPGLASIAIFTVSFFPQLAAGKPHAPYKQKINPIESVSIFSIHFSPQVAAGKSG
jgi:hypothetical protein